MWKKNTDNPILIREIVLPHNSRGWLVIDSAGGGSATGGVRFGANVSPDEVRELSEEMTLKFSFLHLPIGGAKSGICCPSPVSPSEKKEIFLEFGKALSSLLQERAYLPGTDMGTMPEDIDQILKGAGLEPQKKDKEINSGYYTAISVFAALKAAASASGIDLKNMRITVQGLGKVGTELIRLAAQNGLKLIATATRQGCLHDPQGLDSEKLIALANQYGDDAVFHYGSIKSVSAEEILTIDTDVLCPCAGSHPIHKGNIEHIKAKIIIPGCNVAASLAVGEMLFSRGILYLPGFVCNSGGVLCYLLANYGFEGEELRVFLSEGIFHKVTRLLARAEEAKISPAQAARQVVSENQERFIRESEHASCGKIRQAYIRFRCGIREMIRTVIWPLVQGSLRGASSVRQRIARTILFQRFFMAICLFAIEISDFFPTCVPI